MALGDILLPEGQSVGALVRAAARKALADKGYTVVEAGSPHYDAATPLNIERRPVLVVVLAGLRDRTHRL